MVPFHWSKIPQKNSPLLFTLHLKTPTLRTFRDPVGGCARLYLSSQAFLSSRRGFFELPKLFQQVKQIVRESEGEYAGSLSLSNENLKNSETS